MTSAEHEVGERLVNDLVDAAGKVLAAPKP
jgi:hypothetical protein